MRNELADIEICCREVIRKTDDVLSWHWDDYTQSMLAVFYVEHAPMISDILRECFASQWDFETVVVAPGRIRELADKLGGIRQQQHLLVTAPDDNAMAYCAWWPWGDGEKVSLRIGLELDANIENNDAIVLNGEFVSWFQEVSVFNTDF